MATISRQGSTSDSSDACHVIVSLSQAATPGVSSPRFRVIANRGAATRKHRRSRRSWTGWWAGRRCWGRSRPRPRRDGSCRASPGMDLSTAPCAPTPSTWPPSTCPGQLPCSSLPCCPKVSLVHERVPHRHLWSFLPPVSLQGAFVRKDFEVGPMSSERISRAGWTWHSTIVITISSVW